MTMKLLRGVLQKIENLNRALYYISSLAILLSAFILTYEVIVRYVLSVPTIWEIESSVYLTIMATYLGAAYGLKDGAHINIDMLTRLLPKGITEKLSLVTSMLSLAFCLLLAWKGWVMWWEATARGWRSESLWGPPLTIPYFFLPLGMTLLCLQYVSLISGIIEKKGGRSHGS
ncbi:MAG: TRAP transporter small permease [Deltaproteobacteria bacterium]|nr:TRAP transporter small permease [Deltaproteobacteria bacterium]